MNKRFYLNEEEKKRILQMHKPRLNQKIIEEQSLQDIQNIILDNGGYVGKLGADNRLGPDTLNAIYNALTKGFAKNNTATAQGTAAPQGTETPAGTQPTGTQGTETPAGTNPTGTNPTGTQPTGTQPTGTQGSTTPTLQSQPAGSMTVANNVSGQQLKAGAPRSAKEIRQDYRQGQQDARQAERGAKKDRKKLERDLKYYQDTYAKLQNRMPEADKLSYQQKIAELQNDLAKA